MNLRNTQWKTQSLAFNEDIADALQQQHHAAQFIAMAGKHLIPQQPDDSNTNMEYILNEEILLGNAMNNGMRVALQLSELKISVLDKANDVKKVIALEGKTMQKVFDKLKQNLSDLGINVTGFKNELHYEIPSHQLDIGAAFSIGDKQNFMENTTYRHNSGIAINETASVYNKAETVKVWPHHFDTGSFIPVSHNDKGEVSQSIGIGWAIPDSMVDEPYYYLSIWMEKPDDSLKTLPALAAGQWMIPNWNGAVLKHSEIQKQNSAEKQFELVKSFYNNGIEILRTHIK